MKSQNSLIVEMVEGENALNCCWLDGVCTHRINVIFCKEFASNTYSFILSIFFESKQNFESRRGCLMRNRLCTHYNNGNNIHINPNGTKQCMEMFSRKMELIQTFHVYAVRKINFIKFITSCIWYTRIHAHKYAERERHARKGCKRDRARNR